MLLSLFGCPSFHRLRCDDVHCISDTCLMIGNCGQCGPYIDSLSSDQYLLAGIDVDYCSTVYQRVRLLTVATTRASSCFLCLRQQCRGLVFASILTLARLSVESIGAGSPLSCYEFFLEGLFPCSSRWMRSSC